VDDEKGGDWDMKRVMEIQSTGCNNPETDCTSWESEIQLSAKQYLCPCPGLSIDFYRSGLICIFLIALLLCNIGFCCADVVNPSNGARLTNEDIECAIAISKLNDCEMACWMPLKDTVTSSKQCLDVVASCREKCAGTSSQVTGSPTTAIPVITPTRKTTTVQTSFRTTATTIPLTVATLPTTLSPYPLHANIYATETYGTAPLRVDFSDTSSGAIQYREWTFGDGYKSDIASPGHTYREPGVYTARLTVYDALGLSDSDSVTVQVLPAGTPTPTPTITITLSPTSQTQPTPTTGSTMTTGIPISAEDATSGVEAGIAGLLGGAIALGAGAGIGRLNGGGPPPGSPQDLEEEYRRLLDTLATEKANRDAWARDGKDSGRDGMISLLEEEAERRRKELEGLGGVPDYGGKVEGPVGPSEIEKDLERNLQNIEGKLKPIDDWASIELNNLHKIDQDLKKFMLNDNIRMQDFDNNRINKITWVGGLSSTGADALNILTLGFSRAYFDACTDQNLGGFFNIHRPLKFIDNMRETYTAEHFRDMALPIDETKTLIRASRGEAQWHEVVGAMSSGFLKVVTLGRISQSMMGKTPVMTDTLTPEIKDFNFSGEHSEIPASEEVKPIVESKLQGEGKSPTDTPTLTYRSKAITEVHEWLNTNPEKKSDYYISMKPDRAADTIRNRLLEPAKKGPIAGMEDNIYASSPGQGPIAAYGGPHAEVVRVPAENIVQVHFSEYRSKYTDLGGNPLDLTKLEGKVIASKAPQGTGDILYYIKDGKPTPKIPGEMCLIWKNGGWSEI
jgi:PKD repeat protein